MALTAKTIGFVNYQGGSQILEEDSFFSLILDGLENRARKKGYNLTYMNISRECVAEGILTIKAAGCRGIVIFATEMEQQDLEPFRKAGIPFVLLDNYFMNLPVNVVKVNNEQGAYIAVKYLYQQGHREIGYLRSGKQISSFEERYRCVRNSLKFFGLEIKNQHVWTLGYPMENAYYEMQKLMQENAALPTAFLADNDLVAAGAMKAVKEAGYRIPEDISFVGFDDRLVCLSTEPKLTTVKLPRKYFGAEAIEMLVRTLDGEKMMNEKLEISTSLELRESVSAIK